MIRIEATYLVKELPKDLSEYPSEEIEQGYLGVGDEATRIRKKGKVYSITKKSMPIPLDKGIREYENINTSKEEFDLLWPLTKKRLKKTRYYISSLVTEIRVDIFHGALEGLALAEVVFDNEDTKRNFEIPQWFGKEVTQIISNQFLAGNKFSELHKEL